LPHVHGITDEGYEAIGVAMGVVVRRHMESGAFDERGHFIRMRA